MSGRAAIAAAKDGDVIDLMGNTISIKKQIAIPRTVTIAVPKRTLTINVTFPNAVEDNATDYQTMTEAKTLNFWNNVMDKAIEVETGKASSAVFKNFLAGDIVADYIKYDMNRDGVVDPKDVAYVLVSWGN